MTISASISASSSSAAPSGPVVVRGAPAAVVAVTDRVGPVDRCGVEEILAGLAELGTWAGWGAERRGQTLLGAATILGWLTGFEGNGWQRRWTHAALMPGRHGSTRSGSRDAPSAPRVRSCVTAWPVCCWVGSCYPAMGSSAPTAPTCCSPRSGR